MRLCNAKCLNANIEYKWISWSRTELHHIVRLKHTALLLSQRTCVLLAGTPQAPETLLFHFRLAAWWTIWFRIQEPIAQK